MIDCATCTTINDARNIARSKVFGRNAGLYPIAVFNTTNALLYQFNVSVERENGMSFTFATNAIVSEEIQSGLTDWINKYGLVSSKSVEINITCPADNVKCNNGDGRNALFEDVQSFARSHPLVVAELTGFSALITQVKIKIGMMSFVVNVEFANGDTFKLKLVTAFSTEGFKLLEVTDALGKPIATSGSGDSGSGGSGINTGVTIYVIGSSSSSQAVTVTICIDGVCSTSVIYV